MRIGSIELKNGLILAPMAGFSDRAMRVVCHEMGAEYSVSEMVSAKAVVYGDKKTHALARIMADEGPVGLQIFGSEPSVMATAAAAIEGGESGGVAPAAIDINMGCPVPKIFSNGEGSALMKNPALIHDIVKAVRGSTSLPVTVKMRLGVDRGHINAIECATAAEEAGAELITLHGRTRVEMYMGNADYGEIRKVKEALHIPLIANGDVTTYGDYLRIKEMTGADGVMIGRGAIGNPFLFREIALRESGGDFTLPTLSEIRMTSLRQLSIAIEEKGEEIAVREARKQIALYFKSRRGSAVLRAKINRAVTFSDVEEAINGIDYE